MARKQKTSSKNKAWINVQKKYHLSDIQIRMAKELELSPKKFGGYANHRQQRWKRPIGVYKASVFQTLWKSKSENVILIELQDE
jgi:hypothetical protein